MKQHHPTACTATWLLSCFFLSGLTLSLAQSALDESASSADYAPILWRLGRATFFDAPNDFRTAVDPQGGGDQFGSILRGSCGYYEQPVTYASQIFNKDSVAGLADANADYFGSCGRCYELRCHDGVVIQQGNEPAVNNASSGNFLSAANITDASGQDFPGNADPGNDGENDVICSRNRDGSQPTIVITVGDSCPCSDNKRWCCGPVWHIDLSYWAFERLAHPSYGTMMLEFRPVSCDTHELLPHFSPGFINRTIYGDKVESGWSWDTYKTDSTAFWAQGAGVNGSNATCATLSGGGMTFTSHGANATGYQPFAKAKSISLWARVGNSSEDASDVSATPSGGPTVATDGAPTVATDGAPVPSPTGGDQIPVPPLKLTLGNTEGAKYCDGNVTLGITEEPVDVDGDYSFFKIPIAKFGCGGKSSPSLAQVDALGIQDAKNTTTISFCIDDLVINL